MLTFEQATERLQAAMATCAEANKNGLKIHGKQYTTVAARIEIFRKHFGSYGAIRTTVIHADDVIVQVKASIDIPIQGAGMVTLAEGDAEENRQASSINRTSALENCATSAIGRALAALGIHGGEFASANEVEQAIHQQNNPVTPAEPAVSAERIQQLHQQLNSCDSLDALGKVFLGLTVAEKKVCESLKDALKVKFSSEPKNGSGSEKASSRPARSAKPQASEPEAANNSGAD